MLLSKFSKIIFVFVIVVIAILYCNNVKAEKNDSEIPEIILAGLKVYAAEGAGATLGKWLAGGPLEEDKASQAQVNMMHQIETYYGKYVGYEVIKINKITPTTKIVYLQMNYELGPLFVYFLCYRKGDKWIIAEFNANTTPQRVLPEHIFYE